MVTRADINELRRRAEQGLPLYEESPPPDSFRPVKHNLSVDDILSALRSEKLVASFKTRIHENINRVNDLETEIAKLRAENEKLEKLVELSEDDCEKPLSDGQRILEGKIVSYLTERGTRIRPGILARDLGSNTIQVGQTVARSTLMQKDTAGNVVLNQWLTQ